MRNERPGRSERNASSVVYWSPIGSGGSRLGRLAADGCGRGPAAAGDALGCAAAATGAASVVVARDATWAGDTSWPECADDLVRRSRPSSSSTRCCSASIRRSSSCMEGCCACTEGDCACAGLASTAIDTAPQKAPIRSMRLPHRLDEIPRLQRGQDSQADALLLLPSVWHMGDTHAVKVPTVSDREH